MTVLVSKRWIPSLSSVRPSYAHYFSLNTITLTTSPIITSFISAWGQAEAEVQCDLVLFSWVAWYIPSLSADTPSDIEGVRS